MKMVGCDVHTRYQQIAMLERETGELVERRLEHESGEAQAFYPALVEPVRVGIEATGPTRWFEPMLAEQGHELWMGDAAPIRASVVLGAPLIRGVRMSGFRRVTAFGTSPSQTGMICPRYFLGMTRGLERWYGGHDLH